MAEHGRPTFVMADHGSRSCASESEAGKRGRTESGRRFAGLGARRIPAGAGHPRTDGRLAGLRGGIRGKIERFGGMGEFVRRRDRGGPRGSPDQGAPGAPAVALARKMPERGQAAKASTPGWRILPARLRNDFGIAHVGSQMPKIKCGQDLRHAWIGKQNQPNTWGSTSMRCWRTER